MNQLPSGYYDYEADLHMVLNKYGVEMIMIVSLFLLVKVKTGVGLVKVIMGSLLMVFLLGWYLNMYMLRMQAQNEYAIFDHDCLSGEKRYNMEHCARMLAKIKESSTTGVLKSWAHNMTEFGPEVFTPWYWQIMFIVIVLCSFFVLNTMVMSSTFFRRRFAKS